LMGMGHTTARGDDSLKIIVAMTVIVVPV